MKSMYNLLLLAVAVLILVACKKQTIEEPSKIDIFPKPDSGYVGDPMPFYANNKMNMFYLYDARDGKAGFHPYNLMQTQNFYEWDYLGTVLPYENKLDSQDLALGTGSIIQGQDGIYHAYYTGHNYTQMTAYKEKVQHAISEDMLQWEKVEEDGFYGDSDDFRDPYIRYIEAYEKYWMLVTTRKNDKPVLERYTSSNLVDWTDKGVFFENPIDGTNMECASLFEYNGFWYLSYSAQGSGNERVLRYVYKKNLDDEWKMTKNNYIDGIGFYAGRFEHMNDRLIASGWVGTKEADLDAGAFNWAGNLVNHEIIQDSNGELHPTIIQEVDALLSQSKKVEVSNAYGAHYKRHKITFDGQQNYETLIFKEYDGEPIKIEMQMDKVEGAQFGFSFNVEEVYGKAEVNFNTKDNRIEFYNQSMKKEKKIEPQFYIDYVYADSIEITALLQGECMTFYVNDEIAFTTRIYEGPGNKFGLYSRSESKMEVSRFNVYSY